jgi:hypothetical protein
MLSQVYLAKWHGCDAAVKCLNPGLFFGGGDMTNHAAFADLVKEADMLGRCRPLRPPLAPPWPQPITNSLYTHAIRGHIVFQHAFVVGSFRRPRLLM